MKTASIVLSAALFGLAAMAAPALAQKGTGEETGVARQGLKLPIEAMSGTIKDIKIGPCEKTTGRFKEGVHLIVQTPEARTINLHLGPSAALQNELKQLSAGKEISFEAFRTERMPKDAYIAKSIKADGKLFTLRNDNLRPVWARGRGGGRGHGMGRGGGNCL
jgi:hypothetical protein